MKPEKKLIISTATILMLSTAVISSETLQGTVEFAKESYVCAASTIYDTEEFSCLIYDDNTIGIRRYKGNSENVIIPGIINGYKVTKIESNAFNKTINKNSIREITIPSNVKFIGDYAFAYCSYLEKINLSDGLETLGESTFICCSSLKTITLPNTVKNIGESSFSECKNLKEVVLSDSLIHLPDYLFSYCESLENIVIPDSVSSIGESVFQGCSNLKFVDLSSSMTEVGTEMFHSCSNLQEIKLPDSITQICARAFYDCKALLGINLPDNLKIIENSAFENCESISSIEFHDSLEEIRSSAFNSTSITGELTIPQSLTVIGSDAFSDTKINGKLVIPDNVTHIGSSAFENIDITELIIEGSPYLHNHAFKNLKHLENINVDTGIETKWENFVFDGCTNLQKLNGEKIVKFFRSGFPTINSTIKDFVTNNMEDDHKTPAGIGFWNTYTQQYVKKVVEREITPEMTDVEKAKVLHDWICNNTKYAYDENGNPDSANKNHVDYSVFFYDSTVCEGYARAYTLLLQEAGFKEDEVYFVSGVNHAWNIVKLNGEYYHIDVCHDDGDGSVYNYSHFMLSDNQVKNNCSSGHSRWSVDKPSKLFNYYDRKIKNITCDYEIMGDLNLDFKMDKTDLEMMKQIIIDNNFKATALQLTIADLTLDGKVDVYDLILLRERFFEITKQPTNAVAPKNEFAEVTVEAQGIDLTYKWYYKNKGDSEFTHAEKYDGLNKYSVQMNEDIDGGQIYCEITNKYGMVLQTEIVTLNLLK